MTAQASATKVLVVDDEPQLRRALDVNLRIRGYEVLLADTGNRALRIAADTRPDAVLLDLGLPDLDGVQVIEGLRGWSSVPIIVLSVRDQEPDKVAALDAGADDYVTKPFGMGELLARLRAALRRHESPSAEVQPVVETAHFTVDLAARRVTVDGQAVHLTPTEWAIVELLVRNEGRLVTQRTVLRDVWGPGYERDTQSLRVHLAHIRRKLEPQPATPTYFLTEPGSGYRFTAGADDR